MDDPFAISCLVVTLLAGAFALFAARRRSWTVRVLAVAIVAPAALFFFAVFFNGAFKSKMAVNETSAIGACLSYYQAQNDYRQKNPTEEYARGMQMLRDNPFGVKATISPELARAEYSMSATPLNGYFFKILTSQGPAGAGGASSYFDNDGRMTQGHALVAFPAHYDADGRNTFIVGPQGVILQADLGADTTLVVSKMTMFDPDVKMWVPAEN